MTLSANDSGNFLIRLGYVTAGLHSGAMREYLVARGASEEQIKAAYDALVTVADAAFYQSKK